MPVMVDFYPWLPERPYPDLILEKLRPGDIHTHVFAQQFPVIDDQGQVFDHLFRARERGVIFDLGHGAASFWFRNAAPAIREGFVPDSISTDLHTGNLNGPVIDMATTMSKLLAMGVPLIEVIARSTIAPAREIGRPQLGTLTPGVEADVAVMALDEGEFGFVDCGQTRIRGFPAAALRADPARRRDRLQPSWTRVALMAAGRRLAEEGRGSLVYALS